MLNLLWRNKIYLRFLSFLNAEIAQVVVKTVAELKAKIRLFCVVNSSPTGQMGAISQTTFSIAFSWMKEVEF